MASKLNFETDFALALLCECTISTNTNIYFISDLKCALLYSFFPLHSLFILTLTQVVTSVPLKTQLAHPTSKSPPEQSQVPGSHFSHIIFSLPAKPQGKIPSQDGLPLRLPTSASWRRHHGPGGLGGYVEVEDLPFISLRLLNDTVAAVTQLTDKTLPSESCISLHPELPKERLTSLRV